MTINYEWNMYIYLEKDLIIEVHDYVCELSNPSWRR